MADAKDGLEFFERGVRMLFDVRRKFLGIEFAPLPPTGFGRQGALLGGHQIAVNRTPGQVKPPGGPDFGTTVLNEFDDPFPQVQRIGFHAKSMSDYVPMSI
jgi:hypothetical protein